MARLATSAGFGLHFGWSVEGPVGSPTKIDCSYLSPEVKISDRLEAATKIYSSNILMSGQFYDLLSDHIKVGIRLVDHITLKVISMRISMWIQWGSQSISHAANPNQFISSQYYLCLMTR